LLPWIALVLVLAFFAQSAGQQLSGAALGSFFGAVAASLGAVPGRGDQPPTPRLVVFLPAFWLLVPGSLGWCPAPSWRQPGQRPGHRRARC
jgi:uncharacterized membrane protein YjjB (DUF3815 family)